MTKHSWKTIGLMSLALMAALLAPQRALADDDDDPPGRVARLGYISGSVSFQPAGTDDWVSAVMNRPVTTGDKLWADTDSRAELHIGSASIRMAGMTGFSFLNLTDNVTQIQLTAGTLRVRVKRLDENENFEIDTPNLAFSVLRPGVYRIDVDENGDTTVIKVRGGQGEITGGGSAFNLRSGEVGTFNGTDQLTADIEGFGNDDDDFDVWCAGRDRHEDLSVSARYVSPDVIGYQDLDDYGGWRPVPEYGQVWFPHTTIVGWAPYRYGHWAYIYPWGYTWIDDAPWGFAPFHYGRWINYNGVWGWVPCPPRAAGVAYVRPVYAPALVAWVGGPHFGVGVAVGGGAGVSVGWFPLGPREVYVPSYPVSRTYVTNVNVSNTVVNTTVINNYYNTTIVNRNTTVINNNVTVIHQTYVNQRVAGAVTATTAHAFTSAQPVARNVVRVDGREVATAPVNAFTPAVPPARQAVLGTGVAARFRPPVAVETRAVVARTAPPPPPVSFARQQQAIQANGGRPLGISQVRQIQPPAAQTVHPMVRMAPLSTPSAPRNFGNRPGQPQNTGGNSAGNAGNNGGNPNQSGATHTPLRSPVYNNQPGPPANTGQPGANTDRPGTPTNQSGATHTPLQPPVYNNQPGPPANTGQPETGNAAGGGNVVPDRRTFKDRPPSAGGGNNNPPAANNAPAGGNAVIPDRGTYNGRSPSAGGGNNNPGTANNPGVGNAGGNRGAGSANTALDSKQQQQLEQLRLKQDQDRQKLEQQQQAERLRLAQQAAGQQRLQQLNQKHDQQLQNMEQKHDTQVQKLQQKHDQERKDTSSKSKDDPKH